MILDQSNNIVVDFSEFDSSYVSRLIENEDQNSIVEK